MNPLRNPLPPAPPPRPALRLLLKPNEAADALGLSENGLMNLVAAGDIPVVRVGTRSVRFSIKDLEHWIAERSTWRPQTQQQAGGPSDGGECEL